MKLKLRIFALMAMLLCFAFQANAQVAKIGSTGYDTFGEALNAAKEMSGDVTVEVYDKVTLSTAFAGSYSSINFVGKGNDAEIYLDVQGYITATGKKVSFKDLTLSKSKGVFINNAGFMNVAFGVYDVVEVAYTNCVFANGAYASSGDVTFTRCTFNCSWEKYGLWAYGNVDATVDGCVFNNERGIKMYAENQAKTTDLTVKNTDFSAVTDKPAIVLTYGESVVLENNTYSSTGTFELDLDGAPNGVAVTSDVAPVCKNDNGACGVLVDGKIYTTVTDAAEVAADGSKVTLLYSTTETVEFADGVNLTLADGVTADNVTVVVSGPVEVAKFEDLKAAVEAGMKVKLTADITVDESITAIDGTELDLNEKTLYINVENSFYNNVTIKNGNIVLGKDDVHVCDGYFEVNAGKTLVLDGVNMSSSAEGIKGYAVFHLKTGANLDLLNSTLNIADNEYAAGYIVYAGEATATVDIVKTTITGSKVNGIVHATTVIDESTVTLTNVTEHGINRSGVTINDANVAISGGTGRGITAQHGDLVITGNSTVEISDMGEATIELRNDKNLSIEETATVTLDVAVNNTTGGTISGDVVLPVYVAQIGETKYTTLADAVAAADGKTITLLRDVELTETLTIPAGKTVALDLNGKTISQTKEQTAGYQMILNDGNLTIDDSSESKAGKISYTDSGNGGEYISDVIYNRSVLVINGGTIENLSSATVASNGYPHAVDTYSGIRDTYVEINGGTIYCAEYSAIRMFCVSATNKADLVINGGTIKGAIDMQNGTKPAALGTLTINDGTFETTKNANNIRFANWNGGATEYGVSAEIKGGSFNGGITTAYVPAAANWNKGIISGGTYAQDMTEYCAEGFACEQNADGTYGIVEAEVELPEVVITDIKSSLTDSDPDLTFALNFAIKDVENLTDEYLEKLFAQYGSWYTDYVLTISGLTDENVTFNSDGSGDGYLAGQYDAWSKNWVSVPFEDVTLANNESIYIMEYAAKLMGQSGLRLTLAEVAEIVQNFDCGVYFTPEFLTANPGLKVDLHLKVFTEDAEGNKVNDINVATNNFKVKDYVAIVHADGKQTTYCKTLADAVAAAEADETITLLANVKLTETLTIPADKTIALDLAGFTISQEKECTESYAMINNKGSLTITGNGEISFKDTSAGDPTFGWGSYTLRNEGTLVVENSTIEHLGEQNSGSVNHMYCAIYQYCGSTTINGGTISTPTYRSVRLWKGDMTINGGTFDGQVWVQAVDDSSNLEINGGTFSPAGVDGSSVFVSNSGYAVELAVTGGTFNTKIGCSDAASLAGAITGGSFTAAAKENTNSALIADGFTFGESDENGLYDIVADPSYVAEWTFDDSNSVDYTNDTELTVGTLTYKRTFIAGIWNPLYLPFEIELTDELLDKFEFAFYNQMHTIDDNGDRIPDDYKMELFIFTSGKLEANYPYFVRPKSADACTMEVVMNNATLYEAEEIELVTNSVLNTFTMSGTHKAMSASDLGASYAVGVDGNWKPSSTGIKAHRLYFTITDRFGNKVNKAIRIVARDENGFEGTTGVEKVETENENDNVVYDLSGRRVENPVKGLYIVNGKKVMF